MTCIHRFEGFPLRAVPRSRRIDAALCSVLLHSVVVAGAVAGHSTIQGHEIPLSIGPSISFRGDVIILLTSG